MFKEVRYPAKHIRQTIIREKSLEINISLTAMYWLNFTDQNSHLLFQREMRRIVMICFLSLLGRIECSISIGRRRTALESKSSAGHFDWYCNNSQYFYSAVLKAYTLWKQCNYLLEGLSCKLILDMSWSLEAKFCQNKAALDWTDLQWVLFSLDCKVRVKPECLHVQILEMFSLQYVAAKDRCSCGAGEIICGFIISFCVMPAVAYCSIVGAWLHQPHEEILLRTCPKPWILKPILQVQTSFMYECIL
jgi:hypothetical protein